MKKTVSLLLLQACIGVVLIAQPQFGGRPMGMDSEKPLAAPPILDIESPDYAAWATEDQYSETNRFAGPIAVDIDPAQTGEWETLSDGKQVWQLQIFVPGAKGLLLFYEDFFLPSGARLFVYTPDKQHKLGAYTTDSAPLGSRFLTGITPGEMAIIEYQAPAGTTRSPFHIWRIDAVYRQSALQKDFGFGTASDCHDNVVCPAGDGWEAERNAVARTLVVVTQGSGWCTGSLLNNTAQDGRLLFLTAFHCMDYYTPLYDLWRFDFYYRSSTCANPTEEPFYRAILGSDFLAGRRANDFLLLDLHPETAVNMELHYLGWDRTNVLPDSGAIINHPSGDIQKISRYASNVSVFDNQITWDNGTVTPPNHHFRLTYNDGTIEPGASGAALLNKKHQVVGQLHGDTGQLNCNSARGYFGRLFMSWEGAGTPQTRLKDWLDPLGLLPDTLGTLQQVQTGLVANAEGLPINNVKVWIRVNGVLTDSVTTSADGRFRLPGNLPEQGILNITLAKEDNYSEGVTTADLGRITRYILALDTLEPLRLLACDVNLSNNISTLDMIRIRRLILTIMPDFGEDGAPSWQFIPQSRAISNPLSPWSSANRQSSYDFDLGGGFLLPNFTGVKNGDANGSASTQ